MSTILRILKFSIIVSLLHKLLVYFFTALLPSLSTKYLGIYLGIDIRAIRLFSIIVFVSAVTYNKFWNKDSIKKALQSGFLVILALTLLISIKMLSSLWLLTDGIYTYAKKPGRGWVGRVHQPDARLGFKPIPGAFGAETFSVGENVRMKYDKDGFRVPIFLEDSMPAKRPFSLFLGCSFTYGSACNAEDTFPYLISKEMGGTSINAAVCSYGLTQIYLQAQALIPKYRPDFVMVEYAPWLTDRAMSRYAPIYFGLLPVPYFTKTKTGDIAVAPPTFQTAVFSLNIDRFKFSKKGPFDYIAFLFRVAAPMYFHDLYFSVVNNIRSLLGLVPAPTQDAEELEIFVYKGIYDICKRNGCKMVVISFGGSTPQYLRFSGDIIFVDPENLLFEKIKNPNDYEREYEHWRTTGLVTVKVDSHYNEKAHKLITEAVVKAIRQTGLRSERSQQR